MADIFLSYAREDESRARLVAETLEGRGWSVWWDRRIPHGKDFNLYIQQQLDDARCIVVLWSAASVASPFVRDEATEGSRNNRLVPAVIESVRQPLGFRQLHAADLCDWNGRATHEEFERLVASIAALAPQLREIPAVAVAPAPEETPFGVGDTSASTGAGILVGATSEPETRKEEEAIGGSLSGPAPPRQSRPRRREKPRAVRDRETTDAPHFPPSGAVDASAEESHAAVGSGPGRELLFAVGALALVGVTTWTFATTGERGLELSSDRLILHNAFVTAIVSGSWAFIRLHARPVLVILPVMLSLVLTRGLAILEGSFTLVGTNAVLANDTLVVVGSVLTILVATVFAGPADVNGQDDGVTGVPDVAAAVAEGSTPASILGLSDAGESVWQCGKCGEMLEPKFDVCWSCGDRRPA